MNVKRIANDPYRKILIAVITSVAGLATTFTVWAASEVYSQTWEAISRNKAAAVEAHQVAAETREQNQGVREELAGMRIQVAALHESSSEVKAQLKDMDRKLSRILEIQARNRAARNQ
jgi:hypothetical protein